MSHRPSRPQACVPRHASPGRGGGKTIQFYVSFLSSVSAIGQAPRPEGADATPNRYSQRLYAVGALGVTLCCYIYYVISEYIGSLNNFPLKKQFLNCCLRGCAGPPPAPPTPANPLYPQCYNISFLWARFYHRAVDTGPSYIFFCYTVWF